MAITAGLAHTELVDKQGFMTAPWQVHFRDADKGLEDVPVREQTIQVPPAGTPPLNASIPVTSIATAPLASGLYQVTAAVRVTRPATVSSSVLVSLFWVDGGVSCTLTLVPAVTGNATTAVGTGTALLHIDASTPISYATTYVSSAAGEMQYAVNLVLESVGGQ
jgi:hypothetical protein